MACVSVSAIWNEIDLCESYLVCCMFKDAVDLSSSIVHRVKNISFEDAAIDDQLDEMILSASMVFVQSMKELGRTKELFVELCTFFGSIAAIPVQVFLTGACMQISEGHTSNLRAIFEEYIGMWKYLDNDIYVLVEEQSKISSNKGDAKHFVMTSEKYFEVAEVYTVSLLGMVFHDLNFAISWTEKANLTEENRQVLLRRLHSLLSAKPSRSDTTKIQKPEKSLNLSTPPAKHSGIETYPKTRKEELHSNKAAGSLITPRRSSKISDQLRCCFWWFHTLRLKVGRIQLVLSGKHLLLGILLVLSFYIFRRRRASWKRSVGTQVSAVKRALVDAWQLAFDVQVNPLAAIQQLPSAPHGIMQ